MKAYKLFRTKKSRPGVLFPLYVLADKEVPFGIWLNAECGEMTDDGGVKSKLGRLCYRPGWHLTEIPYAKHIGIKQDGIVRWMHDDEVWCECEFSDSVDYQEEADANGLREDGTISKPKAMLKRIPENGYYRYKSSPLMYKEWFIAGAMKVNRVITDREVEEICLEHHVAPLLHRKAFDYSVFE